MGFSASDLLSDMDATDRLGIRLAHQLRPGDTVFLFGQIGAGKTHMARAVISALFSAEGFSQIDVPSPTYTLVQTYDLKLATVWHADLYRLADASEIAELGLDEAFGRDITLVEWPEMIEVPPINVLKVTLSVEGTGRRVVLTSDSPRWSDLSKLLDNAHA